MSEGGVVKSTGFVMPVGNGAVGKTSLALALREDTPTANREAELARLRKTKNLEFEFVLDQVRVNGSTYDIVQQFLIPPGQKESEGDGTGRSYEEVVGIYRFYLERIDVVLLSYKVTLQESFNDLEYWISLVSPLCDETSHFILVGTHLDQQSAREVSPASVEAGRSFVRELMRRHLPGWRGECLSIEVSNLSGENIQRLRNLISVCILHARGELQPSNPNPA